MKYQIGRGLEKVYPIDQFVFNLEDRMNNRLLMFNIKTLLHFLISWETNIRQKKDYKAGGYTRGQFL